MAISELQVAFTGPDLRAMAEALRDLDLFSGGPALLWVDGQAWERPGLDWLDRTVDAKEGWSAWFGARPGPLDAIGLPTAPTGPYGLVQQAPGVIRLGVYPWEPDIADMLELVSEVPFHQASTRSIHPSWTASPTPKRTPPFLRMSPVHHPHGFAAALRGPGHLAMCSPRWLERGPWKLSKFEEISVVQFHDLAAGPDEALEQALPGWRAFGLSPEGGLFDLAAPTLGEPSYDRAEQRLRIEVFHALYPPELTAMAAWRVRPTKNRVERVRLVFATRQLAEMHIHECWMRNLECYYVLDGRERRVGHGYSVPIQKPEWVTRLG